MRGLVLIACVAAASTLVTLGATRDRTDTPVAAAATTWVRPVTCKSARQAVVYYRAITWALQAERGGELADRTPIVRGKSCRWARVVASLWRLRAIDARASLRAWEIRMRDPRELARWLLRDDPGAYDCLMYVVSKENARMDPTLDFGGGHGNVYEAYGIPQAKPGYKMASHGPDWRTNPETQLRWMIDYMRGRYGSVCGATAHHQAAGWY